MCRSSSSSVEVLEESQGLPQRPAADLVEREPLEPDGRGVVAQPRSHAAGARDVVDHPLQLEAIDERDPRRLLDRREQPLVLEREARLDGSARFLPRLARTSGWQPRCPVERCTTSLPRRGG